MSPRVWFVTGASRGFGLLLVQRVLAAGESVVATMRNPSAAPVYQELTSKYSANLLTLELDVSSSESAIAAAFDKAKERFGRVDIVLNNAGYAGLGMIEGMPLEEARKIMDANFWGAVTVTRAACAFFRDVNKPQGGLILQNSSMSAVKSHIFNGFYAASKAALNRVTESLLQELDPAWNIKIVTLETGSFKTGIFSSQTDKDTAELRIRSHPAYTNPAIPAVAAQAMKNVAVAETFLTGDPEKWVDRVLKIVDMEEKPLVVPLGHDAWAHRDGVQSAFADEEAKFGTRSWSDGMNFA